MGPSRGKMPRVTTIPTELQSAFDQERVASRSAFERSREPHLLKQATVRMYGRLAELQARVRDQQKVNIACEAGCHHCCHLRVEVRPYEAFVLADFIRGEFSAMSLSEILAKLEANLAKIAPLSPDGHTRAGIPCALLDPHGRCSVYQARPAACRKYYSTDLATCADARAHPEAPLARDIEHETLRLAGNAVALGFAKGVEDAGLDAVRVELHRALVSALKNPKSEKRWRDGKKPFV